MDEFNKEWRDNVDNMNIQFRLNVYKLLIKPVNNTNMSYLSRQISSTFTSVFDPHLINNNIKLKIDELDGGIDIYWDIPKEEINCCGRIDSLDGEDPYWHFNLKLYHEFKELYNDR